MISREQFLVAKPETFLSAGTTASHESERFAARDGGEFSEEADRAEQGERLRRVAHLLRREARLLQQRADFLARHADHLEALFAASK